MQKSQIVTNRKQKASSAATLKASHLKIVSERDTNMNNIAQNQNNQVDQAYNTASNALDAVTLAIEVMQGLDTLLSTINLHIGNKPELSNIANLAKLGLYYTDNQFSNLTIQKLDLEKSIKGLLVEGGYANE